MNTLFYNEFQKKRLHIFKTYFFYILTDVGSSEYSLTDISATDSEFEHAIPHDLDQRMFALMGRASGNVKADEEEVKSNVTQPPVANKDDIANGELAYGNLTMYLETNQIGIHGNQKIEAKEVADGKVIEEADGNVKEEAYRGDHVKNEEVGQAVQPEQDSLDGLNTEFKSFTF